MTRKALRFYLVILTAVVATTWADLSLACSCMEITDIRDHARSVDTIFAGTVTNRGVFNPDHDSPFIVRLKRILGIQPKSPAPEFTFDLRVDEPLKGVRGSTIRVYTPDTSAACGVDLVIGKKYLVFSRNSDNRNLVSLCSATSEYEARSMEFLQLVRQAVRGSSNSALQRTGDE